jgi:hypothetical protein
LPTFSTLKKNSGLLEARLLGYRDASTFTGFCSRHDTVLFAPLETVPFTGTAEQCFLLGFRAVARELFGKQAQLQALEVVLRADSGTHELAQLRHQQEWMPHFVGVREGVRDMVRLKQRYDAVQRSGDLSAIRSYIVFIEQTPDFMACGGLHPLWDFAGNVLQELTLGSVPDTFTFATIACESGGAIVFTWLGDARAPLSFVESLDALRDQDIPAAVSRFTFSSCENTYLRPEWWEQLPTVAQTALLARTQLAMSHTKFEKPTILMDDGLRPVSWAVASRVRAFA